MRLLLVLALVSASCVCKPQSSGDGGVDGGRLDAGAQCVDGAACGDGGVCTGGTCCATSQVCGSACCGAGALCSFLRCVAPGGECRDSSDCAADYFCDLTRSTPATSDGGVCVTAPTPGQCLPRPPQCPPDAGSAIGQSCVEQCRFARATQQFRPTVKYSWGSAVAPFASDVMMAPIVAQLDDDDCDGRITSQDMPDLIFVTFASGKYTETGIVHALSVKNGKLAEKWARPGAINAMSQLASGNIDGQPGNEVVGCDTGEVTALRGKDGTVLWNTTDAGTCRMPSLADLDGDGQPEVITEARVLDGVTGAVKQVLPASANNVVADLDGDGTPDIISAAQALHGDGTPLASVSGPAGWVAVGDLDKNGLPEVVTVNSATHMMSVWTYDATAATKARLIRANIDINANLDPARCPAGSAGNLHGGGPPTIGDFNADGFPDVALAGGVGYAVFDGKRLTDGSPVASTLLWIRATQDCSSAATGSTLFDFDGDGKVEAVYGDELNLHVYDSATGAELFTTCNTSGTLIEYPLIADLDNDGQADLIVVSNAYAFACSDGVTRHSGVRVFSSMDNNWVVTRRVWNQHAYVVTNVDEDGRIPSPARSNWLTTGLNNFRQNKQPGLEFAAADAVVSLTATCEASGINFRGSVRNLGEASMPPGVKVELVVNPGTAASRVLTTLATTRALGPTQAEPFLFVSADLSLGNKPVVARIVPGSVRECRTDNNVSAPPTTACIN